VRQVLLTLGILTVAAIIVWAGEKFFGDIA
jgi:hypothetical protein